MTEIEMEIVCHAASLVRNKRPSVADTPFRRATQSKERFSDVDRHRQRISIESPRTFPVKVEHWSSVAEMPAVAFPLHQPCTPPPSDLPQHPPATTSSARREQLSLLLSANP